MANKKFNVQVPSAQYHTGSYDTFGRFASYFYQIDFIRALGPKTVLEIGVGNGTVARYLAANGHEVTTCDFDKSLKPDVVADIRDLPLPDRSVDAVLACEILEHIPFADVPKALSEIARVTKRHAIVSVPYHGGTVETIVNFAIPSVLRKTLRLSLRMPYFLSNIRFEDSGEHYWEVGRRGYGKRTVRDAIAKEFRIIKDFHPHLNPGHYFLILEKRKR